MKRIVSAITAICLLIAFLPAAITAETYEDLTYTVSGGNVTITDCAETATGELTIPATIGDYPVTTIGISAFADCVGLTGITLGENVTTIGDYAFSGCTQLTALNVSSNVTAFGAAVVSGCTALSAITVAEGNPVYHSVGNCLIETSSKTLVAGCKSSVIPTDGTVTAIGRLAFYRCEGLTAVTLPESILSVGDSAFEGCTQLAEASLGSNVKTLGNSVFLDCAALAQIAIPDSVTAMGVFVFSGCTGLTSATVGDQVTTIGNSVFSGCTALKDITLGSSLTTIDVFAFSGCAALAEITLPNSVTTIGNFAFYNCGALEEALIPGNVSAIGNNAFAGCQALCLSIREGNTYAISYAAENDIDYILVGLGSLAVTSVSLRPREAGVYFGSSLAWAEGDSQVQSYGIVLSLENELPVADGSDEKSLYTQGGTSVLVNGVLVEGLETQANAERAQMGIYARVYVQLVSGEYVYGDVVQVSLQNVVVAAHNQWSKLTDVQKNGMTQMYAKYTDVMSSWDLPNLQEA